MKILVVTYSSELNGGANRSLLMVVEKLKKNYSHDITVIMPSEGELCKELIKRGIDWKICRYHPIGMANTSSIIDIGRYIKYKINAKRNECSAKKLCIDMMPRDYDIVYLNGNGASYGANIALNLKIPYIWHMRGEIYKKSFYLKEIESLIISCNKIIAISQDMKELYQENNVLSRANIQVVLNGIDIYDIHKSSLCRDSGFHIVQCGRISPEKCQLDAILAMEILVKKYRDIFLHIVGDSYGVNGKKYENSVKRIVKEKNLTKNVILEGYQRDMGTFREKMNCELICSLREPFGRVTVEGLRSGLIVIGANTGGTKEILKDKVTGYLYEQGNINALAQTIEFAYLHPEEATVIANNGYEYSITHFLPDDTVKQINEIIETTVETSKNYKIINPC